MSFALISLICTYQNMLYSSILIYEAQSYHTTMITLLYKCISTMYRNLSQCYHKLPIPILHYHENYTLIQYTMNRQSSHNSIFFQNCLQSSDNNARNSTSLHDSRANFTMRVTFAFTGHWPSIGTRPCRSNVAGRVDCTTNVPFTRHDACERSVRRLYT